MANLLSHTTKDIFHNVNNSWTSVLYSTLLISGSELAKTDWEKLDYKPDEEILISILQLWIETFSNLSNCLCDNPIRDVLFVTLYEPKGSAGWFRGRQLVPLGTLYLTRNELL